MNRKIIIPLVLASFCMVGCNQDEGTKLNKPVLSVNESTDGLKWSNVEGADHYEISVNEGEATTVESYAFADKVGSYSVRVRAVDADGNTSDYSDAFEYTTAETGLSDLAVSGSTISWSAMNGKYVEVSRNGGEYEKLEGNPKSYVAPGWGVYTFREGAGWNNDIKTFFVEGVSATQSAFVSVPATKDLVIEDGSAEDDLSLMENYTIMKYDNNQWNASTARMSPVEDGKELFGQNSIKVQAWRHSAWFKFAKDVEINGSYDTVEIALKGNKGFERASISFEITEDIVLAGQNLKGTYVSYDFGTLSTTWKKYRVSLDDENWKVKLGGVKEMKVSEVLSIISASGVKVTSLSQLLPATTSAQFKTFAEADQNWSSMYLYYNGFALRNTGITKTQVEEFASLKEKYSAINCGIDGADILFNKTKDAATISGKVGGVAVSYDFAASLDHTTLTLTNDNCTIVLDTEDGGETFVASSVTGSDASLFNGIIFIQYAPANIVTIDDFESYESTGVGYDQSHGKDERSGARASYFSDYYCDGASDEFAGNGWSLMGSTDYLGLDKNKAHTGNNSLQCKASDWNALRMASWDLLAGDGEGWASATTFSFWGKGGNYDHKLKVRVYSCPRVGKDLNNAGSNDVSEYKEIIIPAKSDWTEYTVALNPDKVYYGFAITTEHSSGQMGGTDYYNIDDIMIYGRINPWEK